jgi:hypothetical protein
MLQAAEELHLLLVPGGKSFHAGDPIRITWLLENRSKNTQSVIAFHDSGNLAQFDELSLQVSRNNGPWQAVSLARPGTVARVVWRDLQPGATLFQQFDLAAAMSVSGLKLDPGTYRLKGEYALASLRTDAGRPSWSGHVATDQIVTFDVS